MDATAIMGTLCVLEGGAAPEDDDGALMTLALTYRAGATASQRYRMRVLVHREGGALETVATGYGATREEAQRDLARDLSVVLSIARPALEVA